MNMNKHKNKKKRKRILNTLFLEFTILLLFHIIFPGFLSLGILLVILSMAPFIYVPAVTRRLISSKKTRKLLSFRFLFLLFLVAIDYLPLRAYSPPSVSVSSSLSSLSSTASSLGIGVLADVVLISTFVEVTETVPPPPVAAATTAPAAVGATPDGNAPEAQATDVATDTVATNTAVVAPVTASVVEGSQPTASGGGQAKVQGFGTVVATSTTAATETETAGADPSSEPGASLSPGLTGAKTSMLSMTTALSGVTTSIRGKSSPIATSTPSPSSTSTPSSSSQKFPTYAAGLASGTAIIAAAGAGTAIFLVRRRHRRHGQRKHSTVKEIGEVNRPFSIRKMSGIINHSNLNIPWAKGDGDNLTKFDDAGDIDPNTCYPRGIIPPDPEQLRERMDDERRKSGASGKEVYDSVVDLGIGYVSSAGVDAGATTTPAEKRDGYFDGYTHENTRPLSGMSMPEHMKPVMTPLKPLYTQGISVPGPIDRIGAISPAPSSVYSRLSRPASIVTSFGDIHARIAGNKNNNILNPQREEYRLRREQVGKALPQFGGYDFMEEEPNRRLNESERPETDEIGRYDSPYTVQQTTIDPNMKGQHDDYFSTRYSAVNQVRQSQGLESQYDDIDLSQNDSYGEGHSDSYGEEAANRRSAGYFGRLFGSKR
jgi:hypothetical protein